MSKSQMFQFTRTLALAAVTFVTARSAQATTAYLTNSLGGQFITSVNWSPNMAPVNPGDIAIITNGATAYLTNGESVLSLGSLLLTNNGGGVLTMANPAVGTTTLTVTNLTVGGLGATTNAMLNLFGGNFTNLFGGTANIGNTSGSTGAVVIAGSSVTAAFAPVLNVGNVGVGTLTVSNGATLSMVNSNNINIGSANGSANGSALYLGGAGAASTITAGTIYVGNNASSNILVINNASVVTPGLQLSSSVGQASGGGAKSSFNTGYITNAATLDLRANTDTSLGLAQNTANCNSNILVIGAGGVVTNAGGGKWNYLSVGNAYGGATIALGNQLVVNNGGKLYTKTSGTATALYIGSVGNGAATSSSGNFVLVTDSGSLLSAAGGVKIGSTTPNQSPNTFNPVMTNNFLVISNGAKVVSANNSFIGNETNANNNFALITGAGSLWDLGGKNLTIGAYGVTANNWLTVTNGGVLTNVTSVTLGGVNSSLNLGTGGTGIVQNVYLNSGSASLNFYGGVLVASGSASLIGNSAGTPGAANVASGTAYVDDGGNSPTLDIGITGAGGLTKLGAGTLTMNAANTYSGDTVSAAGTLNIANSQALQNSALDTDGAGTFSWGVSPVIVAGIKGSNTLTLGGALTVNNSGNYTFNPLITDTGSGSLTKSGAGTLTLTNNNTYNGGTTISNGVLSVNNNNAGSATGPGMVYIYGGALSGTGTVAQVTVSGPNGTIAPGNSVGTINIGSLTMNAGGTYNFEFGTGNDKIAVGNTDGLTINGGSFNLYQAGTLNPFSVNGTYNLISYSGTIFGTGPSALTVANGVTGKKYTFSANGSWVQLTIADNAIVWNGASLVDSLWQTPANWGGTAPSAGNPLTFGGSTRLNNTNDFAANTQFGGIAFKTGAGSFTLNGNDVNLTANVENDSANTQTVNLPLWMDNGGRRFSAVAGNLVVNGQISENAGSWALTKDGTNSLTLSAANFYSGGTVVNAGTLVVNNPTALSSGPLTVNSGAVSLAAPLNLAGDLIGASGTALNLGASTLTLGQSGATEFAGTVTNTGSLAMNGSGTVKLSGANKYSGGTVINAGVVQANNATALGIGPVAITNSLLQLSQSTIVGTLEGDSTAAIDLGTGTLNLSQSGTSTIASLITNSGSLLKTGSGTVTLANANTYSGGTVISNGVLSLASDNSLGSGAVAVNGGVLRLAMSVAQSAALSGVAPGLVDLGTNTLTLNQGSASTFGGTITDTGSLTFDGSGSFSSLTLTNTNSFSGGLAISNGTVFATVSGALGTGPITLAKGTLSFGGTNGTSQTVNNAIYLAGANQTIQLGSSASQNMQVTFTGNITNYDSGTGTLIITEPSTLGNSTNGKVAFVGNNVSLGARSLDLVGLNLSGYLPISNAVVTLTTGNLTGRQLGNNAGNSALPGGIVLQGNTTMTLDSGYIGGSGPNFQLAIQDQAHLTVPTIAGTGNGMYFNLNGGTMTVGTIELTNTVSAMYFNGGVLQSSAASSDFIQGTNVTLTVQNGGALLDPQANPVTINLPFTGTGTNGLVKLGTGTLTLTATNTYTGPTTVSNGVLALTDTTLITNSSAFDVRASATLDVSGRTDQTLALVANQTLKGKGQVVGNVTAPVGATVSPGESIGTLTVSGTVTLGGKAYMELNRTNAQNCDKLVAGSLAAAGGTLVVTNIGPALVAGDSFQLFSSAPASSFASVSLPVGDNGMLYTWTNKLAIDGSIAVLTANAVVTVNTNSTNITYQVTNNNTLVLSWPADHIGWRLLMQTNNLTKGISTNTNDWGTVNGSASTNRVNITIDPTKPTEFYRMVYP